MPRFGSHLRVILVLNIYFLRKFEPNSIKDNILQINKVRTSSIDVNTGRKKVLKCDITREHIFVQLNSFKIMQVKSTEFLFIITSMFLYFTLTMQKNYIKHNAVD